MKDLIYKNGSTFEYSGFIEPFIIQSESELSGIPVSNNAQAAVILGDGSGMTVKIRLPGGTWTEV